MISWKTPNVLTSLSKCWFKSSVIPKRIEYFHKSWKMCIVGENGTWKRMLPSQSLEHQRGRRLQISHFSSSQIHCSNKSGMYGCSSSTGTAKGKHWHIVKHNVYLYCIYTNMCFFFAGIMLLRLIVHELFHKITYGWAPPNH